MGAVYAQFPDEPEVATLYADALMNLTPWELWDLRTGEPAPGSRANEASEVLERLMASPSGHHHPGGLHFYIHLWEMSATPEREQVIDFAAAYAPYYIAVIGPADLKVAGKEDLAGKSIAVNRGTLEDTSLTEAAPASADIKRFDNYNAVIQAFISGQTQLMVVGNDVGAQVLAKQDQLKPEQKFQLLTSPSHIGLNKGEDRLKAAINDAIAKMLADGQLNASSEMWLKTPLNPENLKD